MLHLTVEQARGFYTERRQPFADGLVEFHDLWPYRVKFIRAGK